MVQKVRKCPKCSGFFLLWTDVCLRCGRVEAASTPVVSDEATTVMDVRVVNVVPTTGAEATGASRGSSGRFKLPESDLPVDDMFDTGQHPLPVEAARAPEPAVPDGPPRHFLVLGYRDVIELVPGRPMTLGRDPRSALRVDRPDVARQHASLEWLGEPPRPFIRDAGSNATFVNGEPVPADLASVLVDGDEIALGKNFKMAYRFSATLEFGTPRPRTETLGRAPEVQARTTERAPSGDSGRFPTATMPSTAATPEKPDIAPEGDLARIPMRAVLAHLEARGFSGVLRVFTSGDSGTILLEQGKPKTVIFGSMTGKDAIGRVSALTAGTYRFHGA